MSPDQIAHIIKQKALEQGFSFCGISKAMFLESEAARLESWLNENRHGEMAYMANHFDKRLDPRLLVPGAKTVVSLMYNYYTPVRQSDPTAPKISTYAYGEDYHEVIREKMTCLWQELEKGIGSIEGRVFVDSAPVLEKAWAAKSGLGWIGKNSTLISKQSGSFFFLAELILDVEATPDGPIKDYCGTCTSCIDSCPTEAIIEPYKVDGSKCISYYTIELKGEFSPEVSKHFDQWMFGCDVCQDVCPWNRFSQHHQEPRFLPSQSLMQLSKTEWKELTQEMFNVLFKHSPVKRTKYAGLKRNIAHVLNAPTND